MKVQEKETPEEFYNNEERRKSNDPKTKSKGKSKNARIG